MIRLPWRIGPRWRAFWDEQRVEFPNWHYTAPLLLWASALAWASLTPPEHLWFWEYRWSDKIGHGLCYAVLGALFLRAWLRDMSPSAGAAAAVWLGASLWGAYLEVLQEFTPMRRLDWRDEVVNVLGAAAGIGVWWAIAARSHRRRRTGPESPLTPAQDRAP